MVKNMALTPNSEEEKKYLQDMIKKHTGQRVVYTTKRAKGGNKI